MRFGEKVDVHAVSCIPWQDVCRALNVQSYPTIRIYEAGSANGTTVARDELHPIHVLKMLGIKVEGSTAKELKEFLSTGKTKKKTQRLGKKHMETEERDSSSFLVPLLSLWVMALGFIVSVFKEKCRVAQRQDQRYRHVKVC